MHRYTQLPTSNTVGLIFTRVVDEGRYCCYLAAIHNACRPCVTVPIAQPGVVVASIIMPASPCSLKKVKFSHTRYRALGPELIPVYRQSARR